MHEDTPYRTIDVRPMSGALGAEVLGVDLAAGVDETQLAEIRRAYLRFGVIFFRDQVLAPEQHVEFARGWAPINVNRFFKPVPGHPLVAEVLKEPWHRTNIGNTWHTDHSYDAAPAMGSVLYALEVPSHGGDTLFANLSLAFDTLSPGLKDLLRRLRALHSSRHVFGPESERSRRAESIEDTGGRLRAADQATQDAVHPVVIRHPETGRETLYVNPRFTLRFEGWTDAESRPLLEYLYRHAVRPEFTCRFRWRKGSMAFWDNRAVWHNALNDYHGQRRMMHRITLEGVPLG